MVQFRSISQDTGGALLIVLIALFMFTILGLYMTLNATTAIHISDNFESRLQASYAALAGLNHARALLRGLSYDDLLKGPNGIFDAGGSYMGEAGVFAFRNPIPLETARTIDIHNPAGAVSMIPDDGIINTGFCDGVNGLVLIPLTGIRMGAGKAPEAAASPMSRYFVKVTDNNGEASEIAGDESDQPYHDGDGIVIVRSLGVAKTLPYRLGPARRLNSTAVYEGRFKRLSTWNLGPALVVLGSDVNAYFDGNCAISGGESAGIGTIDTLPGDSAMPDQIISAAVEQCADISEEVFPGFAVREISGDILSNKDQSLLLNPEYLWDFAKNQAPKVADPFFAGSQKWSASQAPYLGYFDCARPANAPEQDPKVAVVNGDLHISGSFSGGGLLIITGDLRISGPFAYSGLILVIGSGRLEVHDSGEGVAGGIVVANISNQDGEIGFGTPHICISGNSRIVAQEDAVRMAIGLLPPSQISFREITNSDP